MLLHHLPQLAVGTNETVGTNERFNTRLCRTTLNTRQLQCSDQLYWVVLKSSEPFKTRKIVLAALSYLRHWCPTVLTKRYNVKMELKMLMRSFRLATTTDEKNYQTIKLLSYELILYTDKSFVRIWLYIIGWFCVYDGWVIVKHEL